MVQIVISQSLDKRTGQYLRGIKEEVAARVRELILPPGGNAGSSCQVLSRGFDRMISASVQKPK